jgi:enoyl-CoA hydratase/carnithine racemase
MSAELRSTGHGQTLVLTLSNPGLRNALDPAIYAAGIEALGSAERNAEVRSVVLTGEGGVFSAGGNLQRLQTQRLQDLPAQQASITALHDWIEAIRTYPKPVIAAVEGSAAGAGLALVLACDLVVAARSARFATAYARVGLSPDGGTSWHLARALPRALAAELLMCGDLVEAERLHALGLVNRLADTGQALQAADTQVTTPMRRAGPARDNERVSSHPQDRPWTIRFLPSTNARRSMPVAGSQPCPLHFDTTSCDAPTSNASRTAT